MNVKGVVQFMRSGRAALSITLKRLGRYPLPRAVR
jgi:hypothetical protein